MCENTSSRALTMKAMHLSRMMRIIREERMREADPSASPGRVLAFLRLAGEVSVADMAMILGARPWSLGKTLAKLEEEGFITREEGERKHLCKVKLTEKGLDPANRPQGRISKVFDTLSEEERAQLAAIFDKLNSEFEKELGLPEDPAERRKALHQKAAGWNHACGPVPPGRFGPGFGPGMF